MTASGSKLAGLALTTVRPDGNNDVLTAALPVDPPEAQAPATMTLDAVQAQATAVLPAWAGAVVQVTEDAVGERVVTATISRPTVSFGLIDYPRAAQALAEEQLDLAPLGGRIRRVVFQGADPVTNETLYVGVSCYQLVSPSSDCSSRVGIDTESAARLPLVSQSEAIFGGVELRPRIADDLLDVRRAQIGT